MGKLKNGKATGKDEVIGEMIKGGDDRVVDWISRLRNMVFKCGWKNICSDHSRQVRKVTEGLIDDEQGELRAKRGCLDQIFTLKQIGEKARLKKCSVCGFYRPGEGI